MIQEQEKNNQGEEPLLNEFLEEFFYPHPLCSKFEMKIAALDVEAKQCLVSGEMTKAPDCITGMQQKAFNQFLKHVKVYGPIFVQLYTHPDWQQEKSMIKQFWFKSENILPAMQSKVRFEKLCNKYYVEPEEKSKLKELFNLFWLSSEESKSNFDESKSNFDESKSNLNESKSNLDENKSDSEESKMDFEIKQDAQNHINNILNRSKRSEMSAKILFVLCCSLPALEFIKTQSGNYRLQQNEQNMLIKLSYIIKSNVTNQTLIVASKFPQLLLETEQYSEQDFSIYSKCLFDLKRLFEDVDNNAIKNTCSCFRIICRLLQIFTIFTEVTSLSAIHKEVKDLLEARLPEKQQQLSEIKAELDQLGEANFEPSQQERIKQYEDNLAIVAIRLTQIIYNLDEELKKIEQKQPSNFEHFKILLFAVGSLWIAFKKGDLVSEETFNSFERTSQCYYAGLNAYHLSKEKSELLQTKALAKKIKTLCLNIHKTINERNAQISLSNV